MVDFNKKLKIDRINLFCDVVTKMANGTPAEVYKEEVFNANKAEALKDLLGIKTQFPDILDVIAEVLKCFPERYTLDDIYDMLYKKDLGL